YVLMGSRLLEKGGFRVISYDARGHGKSQPAQSPDSYTYSTLMSDARAVMAAVGTQSPIVVGISMGAHTAAALLGESGNTIGAARFITPAYSPEMIFDAESAALWDGLADALESGGPEAFVGKMDADALDPRWRDAVRKATLQRMAQHEYPAAVADALRAVPRSRPFESWNDLQSLDMPTAVIGSQDSADPSHPLEVAQEWAQAIPDSDLLVEEDGQSPLAWRGAAISRAVQSLS
ncbi:MAG: alpha/beta fold hydrolase, partial [Actinomycetes bacterium]